MLDKFNKINANDLNKIVQLGSDANKKKTQIDSLQQQLNSGTSIFTVASNGSGKKAEQAKLETELAQLKNEYSNYNDEYTSELGNLNDTNSQQVKNALKFGTTINDDDLNSNNTQNAQKKGNNPFQNMA